MNMGVDLNIIILGQSDINIIAAYQETSQQTVNIQKTQNMRNELDRDQVE